MVTSVTPVPEQQHMPRAQARVGGQDAHVRFDLGAYIDSSTSTTQLANETLDQSHAATRNRAGEYCCNQQYSVTAITTSTGTIAERYAYSAYGQPTILDASGSILSTSSISNRYTYTGREWDGTLGLYHFRARWMSPSAGRFLARDPIQYKGGKHLYNNSFDVRWIDPSGTKVKIGDCQAAADKFLNDNKAEFSKRCRNWKNDRWGVNYSLSIKCKACNRDEHSGAGGWTVCNKDNSKQIEVVICANRFDKVAELDSAFKHEFQHATDLCSCKQRCNIMQNDEGETWTQTCMDIACAELRAYASDGNCENPPNGESKEQCIRQKVVRAVKKQCAEHIDPERAVDAVWDSCYFANPKEPPKFPDKY